MPKPTVQTNPSANTSPNKTSLKTSVRRKYIDLRNISGGQCIRKFLHTSFEGLNKDMKDRKGGALLS
jgi:hypothetical protein